MMTARRTSIDTIVAIMEDGPDPVSGMGGRDAMGNDGGTIEVGMEIMPGDDFDTEVEEACNSFHPDDYMLAKQLIAQVGSV
ncbi:MAG: hypothetical protein ACTSPB_26865, partial [Candidatus Thorarchaeota archaeon]